MQFSEFDNAETQKLQVFQEIDIRSIFNIFKLQKINLSLFVAIFTIQKFRNDPLRGFRRNNAVFRIFTMHIPVFLGRFSLSNFYNFHNAEITKFQVFVHLSDFRVCTTQIVKLCKFSKCRNPKTVGFCLFVKFSQCRYSVNFQN